MEKVNREAFVDPHYSRDNSSVLEKEGFVSSSELHVDHFGSPTLCLNFGADANKYWLRAQARVDVGERVRIIYDSRSTTGKEVLCLEVMNIDWTHPVYRVLPNIPTSNPLSH